MKSKVISFDTAVCSLKAIKMAAHDMANEASIKIDIAEKDKIIVTLNKQTDYSMSIDDIANYFYKLAIEHQIRIEIEEEYRIIRQIIVAQAFHPCENLQDIVALLKK